MAWQSSSSDREAGPHSGARAVCAVRAPCDVSCKAEMLMQK